MYSVPIEKNRVRVSIPNAIVVVYKLFWYSAERGVGVAGVWEAAAAVAEPEEIPARKVAVGRVYWLGRSVIVDVEVCVTLICVWSGVCWIQVLVGCVCHRLDE